MSEKCDTCIYEPGSCDGKEQAYGGNGEVITCDAYKGTDEPLPQGISQVQAGEDLEAGEAVTIIEKKAYKLPTMDNPNQDCSVCHQPLVEIPVNSRVRSIVCNNHKCALFRVRIGSHSIKPEAPYIPKGSYQCSCGMMHRVTSKIGKAHFERRKSSAE